MAKVGEKAFVGPFYHWGGQVLLPGVDGSWHWVDMLTAKRRVVPYSPTLPALACWLAVDGNREALVELLEWDLEHAFPRIDLEHQIRTLIAALEPTP